MRIGEVADGAGVGVETVRFYEQRGLIGRPPRPNDGGTIWWSKWPRRATC